MATLIIKLTPLYDRQLQLVDWPNQTKFWIYICGVMIIQTETEN